MKTMPKLRLHVPEPRFRPGDTVDFSNLRFPAPGETRRPAVDTAHEEMTDLAYGLIRVLDEAGQAQGPWDPKLSAEVLRRGLADMVLTRIFDDHMFRAQRQGKTSFYIKCTGEEAIGCAQAQILRKDDMCFATYRSHAILIARGYPLLTMMNQIYNNARDPIDGHQLPILYSARDHGYFTLSGNLGTQFPQAVGWAMASAYKGDHRIASGYVGEGATATADFHHALTFAAVYRAPVLLNIVNNQWAISSYQGIAGGEETTFASKAHGYGLPALRVDGNDFLAVYAATAWAAERARTNHGATVIEFYTYRAAGHSTSDDPSKYRPADEYEHWPLGDPIARLKQHLIALGEWSQKQHAELEAELTDVVQRTNKEAEAIGTLGHGKPSRRKMFEHVFKEPDWRIVEQRREAGN
ncbi:MAG: 3-methyl-2-oxobutanoate dehydrogenase (2-methylpropanoyl-transferring) subunit alpha [Alphaproteobacteria bacterium]|nr:MAG: 3-methyl-2-oxobutanoate dehydrogenase (2-methylpropanoyl-transferring) subunit alpha [Alphaproteobacteria bacterium]